MTGPECATHPELDWFTPADYPQAAAICGTCDQRAGCEAEARARGEQHGLWGQVVFDVPDAADFLLDGMPAAPAVEIRHGERSTYTSGKCTTCPRCLAANARYRSDWLTKRADVTDRQASEPAQLDLWETA